jgi:hypothetical protein
VKYVPENGFRQNTGIGLGGGIRYFLGKTTGQPLICQIGTGLEYATFSSKVSFDRISEEYEHGTGIDKSLFFYSLNNYKEQQNIAMLSVPLLIRFQTNRHSRIRYNFLGGLKFGIPVSAKAKIDPGTASASGNYEYEGETYTDLPQHGFPEGLKLPETQSDIKLSIATSMTLETGISVKNFYTGLYFDFSLNNMQKVKDKHVIEYRDADSFVHNSILNTGLVNEINIYSFGLKVQIQFGLKKTKKIENENLN